MNYPIFKQLGFAFYKVTSSEMYVEVYPKDDINEPSILVGVSCKWINRVMEGETIPENTFIDAYVRALHDIHKEVNPEGLEMSANNSAAPDLLNSLIMCINYVGGISKQSEPAMNAWLAAKAAIEKATKGNLITPVNHQLSPGLEIY